jgi:inositol-1,4,5-trisphosphate 5-phosphatase
MMEETFSHEEIVQAIKAKNLKQLQDKDQLNHVKNENSAFHELSESLIDFAPTFKHVIGSDDYDIKRRPAWTDRILYRVNTYNLEDLGKELTIFVDFPSKRKNRFKDKVLRAIEGT